MIWPRFGGQEIMWYFLPSLFARTFKVINSHHINWRFKTIEKLAQKRPDGTHFSSLIGISHRDFEKIEEILLRAISEIDQVVQNSGEEEAFVVNLDFFRL